MEGEDFQKLQEYKKELPISSLGLSERALNTMDRTGIKTIGQLIECAGTDLLNIRNFGYNQLEEVREVLHENGFQLADERGEHGQ